MCPTGTLISGLREPRVGIMASRQLQSQHRYLQAVGARRSPYNPRALNLGLELLCNAFPVGAMILDGDYRVLFSNRESVDLLCRWNGHRARAIRVPNEIISACEGLRHGGAAPQRVRPKFGGRVFLRHPRSPHLSAVVALERSPRDRRLALFCVFLHDRLRDNLAAGRRDQLAMLTVAERQVAKLVAEGMRNQEIAEALGKSVTTVKSQLGAVFGKLQVGSRTQLAALLRSA
jgi:DNA-binding CsgD family transcriptional regulator